MDNLQEKLLEANTYARMSCTRWNKPRNRFEKKFLANFFRFRRRKFRMKYREMAREYWESDQHQKLMDYYRSGHTGVDTYPWPYSSPLFADWDESDEADDYSLISDQSGCVVKYATSYVAWKIFEATGAWPQRKTNVRMDARNWGQFLAEAGYSEVVEKPTEPKHFVGIDPEEGEWGSVVWFERTNINMDGCVIVSTYRDKRYVYETVNAKNYIWVQIN